MEESYRTPLTLDLDEDATFDDLKALINDEESFEPEDQHMYLGFVPLDSFLPVKDFCLPGDTVDVHIWQQEALENVSFSMQIENTITMIVGSREKFRRIPFRKNRDFELQSDFFHKHQKFGIVTATAGDIGDKVFECDIYQVEDGKRVEYRDGKFFQYIGTLLQEMHVHHQGYGTEV